MSQSETINRYIIIGGGIAGVSAAEAVHALQAGSRYQLNI